VRKVYVIEIDGSLTADHLRTLKRGVYLDGRRTGGAEVKVLRKGPSHSLIEATLTEGRTREVRRILLMFALKVERLKRVAIGPITDRGLKVGSFRPLQPFEVAKLKRCGMLPMG
jgi:23S rRNA pseudouridine2605 synthase